ncbi:MAG: carboxymuconolactone decarboxylase family protein [Acidimicrobiales bacterium]
MPRLRQVSRSDTDDPLVRSLYDTLFDGRDPVAEPGTAAGTPGDWWTVFALVPDVFKHATRGFGLYQSPDRVLDPTLRELGQTRAGWLVGSSFVYSQHCKSCRELGMAEDKIAAITSYQVSDLFSPAERAVLAYTDALALDGGRVDDAVFEALRLHLSDEEILELTYITAMYIMHAIISRALKTEWDDRPEPVVEVSGPGA